GLLRVHDVAVLHVPAGGTAVRRRMAVRLLAIGLVGACFSFRFHPDAAGTLIVGTTRTGVSVAAGSSGRRNRLDRIVVTAGFFVRLTARGGEAHRQREKEGQEELVRRGHGSDSFLSVGLAEAETALFAGFLVAVGVVRARDVVRLSQLHVLVVAIAGVRRR